MKRELIKQIFADNRGEREALVKGWVKSLRKSKNFSFIVLNDGSTQLDLQVVLDTNLANYEEVVKLNTGSSLAISGVLVQSQGKQQALELQAKEVTIYSATGEDYPLQKKRTSFEFLREVAHLRPRTNTFGAVFRVRHALAMATHQFFDERNFFYLNSPIITGSDAEGAGELFRVSTLPVKSDAFEQDYFGKQTFLAVTGQLEAEAFALGMGAVYTFGPTFRSENSNTARHLAEFWMIEPEVAFAELEDVAQLAGDYVQYLIRAALERCPEEMAFFDKRIKPGLIETLTHVRDTAFQRVTYTKAIEILESASTSFEFPVKWGMDLQTEHERYLAEDHFKGPVIVTDYPKEIKAFYMKQNDDGKTVRAMDVLVPGVGELIGGSQREDDLDKLKKRMGELGMDEKEYWWYLELRKFGGAPHAGFGLGFERAMMYITGMANIRDVIPFARTPKNADF